MFLELCETLLGFGTFFRQSVKNKLSVSYVLPHKFVFISVGHVFDSSLQITVYWLQEWVLLRDNIILVKNLLHCLIISLLCVECKTLQFVLILTVVKNCLRQNNISLNRILQIVKFWPPSRFDLHGVEHVTINHLAFAVLDVSVTHFLQEARFSILQGCHLFLSHPGDVANLSSPADHVVLQFMNPLKLILLKVLIFNLGLQIPIFFLMNLSHSCNFLFVFLSFVLKMIIYLPSMRHPEISLGHRNKTPLEYNLWLLLRKKLCEHI